MHIYFSLFCALTIWKGYILISVNCNKEFCRLSPYTVWLHKGPSIFSLVLLVFLELGLIGYEHAGTHDFSQDES